MSSPSAAAAGDSSSTTTSSAAEIMLFGVRVFVDSIRKSVSLNNLSQYQHLNNHNHNHNHNNNEISKDSVVAVAGYASADESAAAAAAPRSSSHRKRGVPWTEEEHTRFLIGLKKLGKGDWRGISKDFVITRTPTQVASHAQKYFIRRSNVNRRRRRSSLFDITTDSVVPTLSDDRNVNQDAAPQSLTQAAAQTISNDISGIRTQIQKPLMESGRFQTLTAYPLTVTPVVLSPSPVVDSVMETGSITPVLQPTSRVPIDFDLNMNSAIDASLSLNLSLSSSSSSSDLDGSSSSRQQKNHAFQFIPTCRSSIIGIA